MYVKCYTYDFSRMAYEDPFWKAQTTVPIIHARAMLAALFHYKIHAADVMRFLGGTYMGEHRDIDAIVIELNKYGIDPWLISQYVRAPNVRCPNHSWPRLVEIMPSFIGEKATILQSTKIWSMCSILSSCIY